MAIYKNLDERSIPGERWKQFHEGKSKIYFISDYGRIKSVKKKTDKAMIIKQRLKKHIKKKDGTLHERLYVKISVNGKLVNKGVSRLVAEAFIPNSDNLPVVAHINNNPLDNRVFNLRWDSYAGNNQQAREDGLIDIKQPTIVLNTNAEVIAKHDGILEALSSYDGKKSKYNDDVHIVGNVIVMKLSYYETLSESECFNICSNCFEYMLRNFYIVDGQLVESRKETTEIVGTYDTFISYHTNNVNVATINNHEVSRFKNLIGVGGYHEE